MSDPDEAFEYQLQTDLDLAGCLNVERVVVKKGPQRYKAAAILTFGSESSGVVSKRELRVQTYQARVFGGGYEFEKATQNWSCENEEIERLQALLNRVFPDAGSYQLVKEGTAAAALVKALATGDVSGEQLKDIIAALVSNAALAEALVDLREAGALATVIDRAKHQRGLSRLRSVVDDSQSTEHDLTAVLKEEWWIFGGRYIDQAKRRNFTVLDQIDIALIRADGALHVVELKQATIPRLVVPHRNHYIVGPEVHAAVAQTMNYLRSLDEQRPTILAELGIDCRRAFATVVVGHPQYVSGDIPLGVIKEALRTYNSHLARIEVLTYQDLVEGADSAFRITSAAPPLEAPDEDDPFAADVTLDPDEPPF